jgi:hypothetical protein
LGYAITAFTIAKRKRVSYILLSLNYHLIFPPININAKRIYETRICLYLTKINFNLIFRRFFVMKYLFCSHRLFSIFFVSSVLSVLFFSAFSIMILKKKILISSKRASLYRNVENWSFCVLSTLKKNMHCNLNTFLVR